MIRAALDPIQSCDVRQVGFISSGETSSRARYREPAEDRHRARLLPVAADPHQGRWKGGGRPALGRGQELRRGSAIACTLIGRRRRIRRAYARSRSVNPHLLGGRRQCDQSLQFRQLLLQGLGRALARRSSQPLEHRHGPGGHLAHQSRQPSLANGARHSGVEPLSVGQMHPARMCSRVTNSRMMER